MSDSPTFPARTNTPVNSAVTRAHSSAKNGDIEVLRAVAILFVLATHWFWSRLTLLGPVGTRVYESTALWSGVDLFFCISGFVIADSLLKNPPAGTSFRDYQRFVVPFWIRRVYRLLPSAWLWIFITLGLTVAFSSTGKFGDLERNLGDGIAALANVANFYYMYCIPKGDCGSLGTYWSLSLEEQFYLVLPSLMFLVRRRVSLVSILLAVCVFQMLLSRPNGFDVAPGSSLWFIRTDAIILGVLLACWRREGSYKLAAPQFLQNRFLAMLFGGLCLVGLATIPAVLGFLRISTGLTALLCAVMVWVASYDRNYLLRPSTLKSVLEWIGARSYAMYLIHFVALDLVNALTLSITGMTPRDLGYGLAMVQLLVVIVLTAVLSELNFRWVETPMRDRGRRVADAWIARRAVSQAGVAGPPAGANRIAQR